MSGVGTMVKFEFALTESGDVFDIKGITEKYRGHKFTCARCNEPMTFSIGKSINKDGTVRKSHFKHQTPYDHEGESIIHYNAVNATYMLLQSRVNDESTLDIRVECRENGDVYTDIDRDHTQRKYVSNLIFDYDIIDSINHVNREAYVGIYKPDITLYMNDTPLTAVEIEYTHAIEQTKMEFLKANGINMLTIHVNCMADVESIRNGLLPKYEYIGNACNPILTTCEMLIGDINTRFNQMESKFNLYMLYKKTLLDGGGIARGKLGILRDSQHEAFNFFKIYKHDTISILIKNGLKRCGDCKHVNHLRNVCRVFVFRNSVLKQPNPHKPIKPIKVINSIGKHQIEEMKLTELDMYISMVCKYYTTMCRDNLHECGVEFNGKW